MEKRTVFEASDGRFFRTEAECLQYERALKDMKLLGEFLSILKTARDKDLTELQRNFARHAINEWEKFKQERSAQEEKKAEGAERSETALAQALRNPKPNRKRETLR